MHTIEMYINRSWSNTITFRLLSIANGFWSQCAQTARHNCELLFILWNRSVDWELILSSCIIEQLESFEASISTKVQDGCKKPGYTVCDSWPHFKHIWVFKSCQESIIVSKQPANNCRPLLNKSAISILLLYELGYIHTWNGKERFWTFSVVW